MSQFASFRACQMPFRLGFPSGVRGTPLEAVWASTEGTGTIRLAMTAMVREKRIFVRAFIWSPCSRLPHRARVPRSEHSLQRDSPRGTHTRKAGNSNHARAEWLLSTAAYRLPDHRS